MPRFLPRICRKCRFRFAPYLGVGVYADDRIMWCRILVDEQVVIARGDMHVRSKALTTEKQTFRVRHVASYTHVGIAFKRIRQVAEGSMEGFEADQCIKQAGSFGIR